MDPNANLEEQLRLANRFANGKGDFMEAERLAELVLALDEWIRGGGFIPAAWKNRDTLKECLANMDGYACTRTKGHTGEHIAGTNNDNSQWARRWAQE